MGCSASSPIPETSGPAAKARTSASVTEQALPIMSVGSTGGSGDGNAIDALETGTKLFMSMHPSRSVDGGKYKAQPG